MKNLTKILILTVFVFVLGIQANAQEKMYEVPVKMLNYSDKTQESMANTAIYKTIQVSETEDMFIYKLKTKPMELQGLKGNLVKLFFLDGDKKVELDSKEIEGEYNKVWEIKTAKEKSKELTISVWVDVMDEIAGGKPGAGEQKAILSMDWDKAKEVKMEEPKKEEPKKEMPKKEEPKKEMPKQDTNKINVSVNKEMIQMDANPYIKNSRTMVPVRFISEALGLKVGWDAKTKTVIVGEEDKVMLVIGENKITKADGTTITIDAPAEISSQRTFVPVRAIAEIFNSKVGWDAKTKTVLIEK